MKTCINDLDVEAWDVESNPCFTGPDSVHWIKPVEELTEKQLKETCTVCLKRWIDRRVHSVRGQS